MSSDSALWPLQQAIFAHLTADATLIAKLTSPGVFDYVPDKKAYPYVTIGDAIETPENVFARNGHEAVVSLHVWSQKRGFAEALDIANDLMRLLDDYAIAVANHTTVFLQHEDTNTVRDPDGITRHVIVRFRWDGQDG